jgi:ABC-type nitrate/sulfonate/bicarbonate transport system ATPase subunit
MLTRLREDAADTAERREAEDAWGAASEAAGVRAAGVGHSFGELRALERIDLEARPGEVVGLVGPSGCGKTTLLELVAGLREPDSGAISVEGEDEAELRLLRCAYMPQRDLLLPWLSAIDNAALALRVAGVPRREARERVRPSFERLGLEGFDQARPAELSGGMRQRVAFLRTLMAGRPVLLLDEPFASLDAITRGELQSWLAGVLAADRHTVLLVTHDVEEALYLSDRVLVLTPRPGRVAAEFEVPDPRAADRVAAVSSTEFARLRQRALRALGGDHG